MGGNTALHAGVRLFGAERSTHQWLYQLSCACVLLLPLLNPACLPACRECAEEWRDVIEKEGEGKLYIGKLGARAVQGWPPCCRCCCFAAAATGKAPCNLPSPTHPC